MLRENVGRGLIVLTALAVGTGRPFLTSHPLSMEGSYEAFAHLFVGALVKREKLYLRPTRTSRQRDGFLTQAASISMSELSGISSCKSIKKSAIAAPSAEAT
jgi:hypothetical protein